MSDVPIRPRASLRTASRPAPKTEPAIPTEDDALYPRSRSSVIPYKPAQPPQQVYRRRQEVYARRKTTVLLLLGAGGAVALFILGSLLLSCVQGVINNINYGYPRTSQLDAVVGHNDSETSQTHFIFLNLHGHIEVIEIPGGDASHARIFTGPTLFGAGQDLVPVTGEIRIEDGRRDLIVHVQNQQIVYVNDGSTFHQQ